MTQSFANQKWLYIKRPPGMVSSEHYQLVNEPIDDLLAPGEVLIANRFLSVDPYMRIQQAHGNSWEAPHPLNSVQQAGVVSQIIASASQDHQVGDWVSAYTGWEKFSKVHQLALTKLNPQKAPVTTALGVLGMPGRTAWFGLMEAGKPKPGETVVVSGAAGAVGSLVVQFAKRSGCTVVAFAGSQAKCDWLEQSLNVDLAINYKNFDNYQALSSYLRERNLNVDVYYDNVGGMISDAIIPLINLRARIVICGQMSQYNGQLDTVELGPRFLHHMLYQRATVQGILARDFSHRMDEMVEIVAPWVTDGKIVFEESIVDGFNLMPQHLASLFNRKSSGKLIVRVGDDND